MNRKRFTSVFLCTVGLLLSPCILQAATYVAGACKANGYPTISAAVAAAAALPGSTVQVCPGMYFEQVVISTPLTLEGITSENSSQAIIFPPSSGLVANVTSAILGVSVAAQVLVETGPVNIKNITVDGTGNELSGSSWLAGIFYASGSSGTVNEVTARYQIDDDEGLGIWAENGNSTPETVTIENSDVHDVDYVGIFIGSNQTTLTATVKGNTVAGESVGPEASIWNLGATGSIANNVLSDFVYDGIYDQGSSVTISDNTTTNTEANIFSGGIFLAGLDEVVKGNLVLNNASGSGISLGTASATVQNNKIVNNYVAIEFDCFTATVSGNTITDAAIGIDQVQNFIVTNTYYGVSTIQTSCDPAASAAKAKPAFFPKKP